MWFGFRLGLNNKVSLNQADNLLSSELSEAARRNGSLGNTTTDSLWRGALTIKLNELQPVGEEASNPAHAYHSV